jgi:hypothetical protein
VNNRFIRFLGVRRSAFCDTILGSPVTTIPPLRYIFISGVAGLPIMLVSIANFGRRQLDTVDGCPITPAIHSKDVQVAITKSQSLRT